MAKPTTVIHRIGPTPEEQRELDLKEIENALIDNKEVILETLELMKYVQDTELLNILKALVAERNDVLHHIVTFIDGSDLTRSMKNMLLLFSTLGQLNVEEMEPLIGKLNGAISEVARIGNKRGGYTSLFQTITDPDLVDGLNTALALLKGLGADPADLEDGVKPDRQQNEDGIKRKEANPSSGKWITAAATAGASMLILRMLFKRDPVK